MSWVAGIDYSTHAIDVVLVDEDDEQLPRWERTELEGHDAWERTRTIDNLFCWSVWWDDVMAVGLEEPRGQNTGVLYRVQGAILANLPPKLLVQPWIPSEWRKAVGLAGNCSKAEVMTESLVLQPDAAYDWPQDAHDAHLIALATRAALETQAT